MLFTIALIRKSPPCLGFYNCSSVKTDLMTSLLVESLDAADIRNWRFDQNSRREIIQILVK